MSLPPLFRTPAEKRKAIFGWVMYDWANSAFATTIMAAVLPVYYHKIATAGGLPGYKATSLWGYTAFVALVIVAVLSPILGAIADQRGGKKKFLTVFALLGILGTALLYFVYTGDWLRASLFYILGNVGFAGANVFYDSLLPHITTPDEVDVVSTWGYAAGYLGGGLLLAVNLAMIMLAPDEQVGLMTRLSFVTVAVWWLLFTIPLWKWVPEPPHVPRPDLAGVNPVRAGFAQLAETFRHIRRYGELFKFLIAFWLYNDGISTIIKMATIYGKEIGIGDTDLIGTLLMVQFVGIPFSIAFGYLAKRIGAKRGIYLALAVYTLIALGGYFMREAWHFWALGVGVATVQGGSQALSRSLFSRLTPKSRSSEFFGFFSVSAKFAGIVGPLLFAVLSDLFQNSRLSIVALVVFFIGGMVLLSRVDVDKGIAVAEAEDAEAGLPAAA